MIPPVGPDIRVSAPFADEDITQLGKIDVIFKDGIGYESKKLIESVRGKVGR
jgi:hypothetical protein